MSLSTGMNRLEDVSEQETAEISRVSTGVAGVDAVLNGGLPWARHHLVRGGPGTGKTSLGLQFLSHGAAPDVLVLYASLSTPEADVRADATATGIDLAGIIIQDLSAPAGLPTRRARAACCAPIRTARPSCRQLVDSRLMVVWSLRGWGS